MEQQRLALAAAVFFPMAAGLISYIIGRKSKKLRDYAVSVTTIAEFILAAGIAVRYGTAGGSCTIPGVCGSACILQRTAFVPCTARWLPLCG